MTLTELLCERARKAAKRGDEESLLTLLDILKHLFGDDSEFFQEFKDELIASDVDHDLEDDE